VCHAPGGVTEPRAPRQTGALNAAGYGGPQCQVPKLDRAASEGIPGRPSLHVWCCIAGAAMVLRKRGGLLFLRGRRAAVHRVHTL